MWVQSSYLQKNNGDVTQAPADDISASRETHARSDLASPSPTNTIAEGNNKVKGTGAASGGGSAAVGNLFGGGTQMPIQREQRTEAAQPTADTAAEATTVKTAPKATPEQAAVEDVAQQLAQRNEAQRSEPAQEAQIAEDVAAQIQQKQDSANKSGKDHISLEDYANNESPVWRNVAYEDNETKATITQQVHNDMVSNGNVVQITDGVSKNVDETLPDLRGMKKADRGPILRQAISTIKANLRQYLGGLTNQNFEFEVNGKILDAKLYNTGIKEVLEKVTNQKAKMLYTTEDIFRNAQYLYSTPDYDGDPNVYRWNYFYTPVKIGNETVGVRIAVRDMAAPQESQIYNWNIKKDAPFGGVGRGKNDRISNDATSSTSNNIIQQGNAEVKGTGAAVSGFAGAASGGGSAVVGNLFGSGTQIPAQTEQRTEAAQPTADTETPATEVQTAQKATPEQAAVEDVAQQLAQRNEAQRSEPAQEAQIAEDVAQQILEKQGAEAGKGNATEESTSVNTDPEDHTPQEQAIIDDYQNSVDEELVEYIEMVKENPGKKLPRYPLNPVTDRAAADIQRITGIDVRGNKTEIEARMVEHIIKDHGESGDTDHSMRDVNDIARIQYVIDNYDSIAHGGTSSAYVYQNQHGRNTNAQTVVMQKKVNGTYFVVEAVPDTKRKTLFVVSAYMSKNGHKETAPSLSGDAEAYRVTSDNATKSDAVSNNSIPNKGIDVKGTGAAEANFSGKAQYQDLLYEGNVQPDRASDARPMEVPKTDGAGNAVSEVAANVYGSQYISDDLASEMETAIEKGDLGYVEISNDKAAGQATANIEKAGGWDGAYMQWHDRVRDGAAGAEMAAQGSSIARKECCSAAFVFRMCALVIVECALVVIADVVILFFGDNTHNKILLDFSASRR